MRNIISIFLVSILMGCASQPPAPISRVPSSNLTVTQVRGDISQFIGKEVRWGGVITQVENKATHTFVEIVSRELRSNGQPKVDGQSGGRFIARYKGFADPVVYQIGLQLTVIGTIEGQSKRTIGEYDYSFPVVSVTSFYLWPVEQEFPEYEYPIPWWYYDPWPYNPWPYPPFYW